MKISIPEFIHGGTSKHETVQFHRYSEESECLRRLAPGGPKIFDVSGNTNWKFPEVSTTFDSTIVTIWKVDLLSSSYQDVTQDERAILKYIIENETLA